MTSKLLGKKAEVLAKKHLQNKGYRFVTANFRRRFGEIDLIFTDENTTVFVEVKARNRLNQGLPEAAVTPYKLKTIEKVAEHFLQTHPNYPQRARIDVVAVQLDKHPPTIRHLVNVTG